MQIGMFNKNSKTFHPQSTLGRAIDAKLLKNTDDRTINALKLKREYLDTKEGIGERIVDSVNDFTEFGINKKRARKVLQKYEQGKLSKKEAESYLKQYEYNKKDVTEMGIDVITSFASLAVFTWVQGFFKNTAMVAFPKTLDAKKLLGIKASNLITPAGILLAGLTGATLKPILKGINKIPADKKFKKKDKAKGKDTLTGFIDGATSPLAGSMKLIGMVPFAMINAGARYLSLSKDNKSFDDFINQQTQNIDAKVIAVAAMGVGAYNSNKKITHWQEAAKKAEANIKRMNIAYPSDMGGADNAFNDIANSTGLIDDKVFAIMNDSSISTDEKIKKLEDYNIFMGKYLQTMTVPPDFEANKLKFGTDNPTDTQLTARKDNPKEYMRYKRTLASSDLGSKIKSACPPSRTAEEAQALIGKSFSDKYQVLKSAGVGTVGETWLAKDKETGKEVVIKLVKKGIDLEKLSNDRQFMLDKLKNSKIENLPTGSNETSIKNKVKSQIEDLFNAWADEIDFAKERENALLLAKNNETFTVPKPIALKDGIYVMEKASGIQLDKLDSYLRENNKKLTHDEKKWLQDQYQKIIDEQNSVPNKGARIIHADPHAGNVFVDLEKKQFIFIDTGNVVQRDGKTSIKTLMSGIDTLTANGGKIVDNLLDDAILPKGLSREKAREEIMKEVQKTVFNCKDFNQNSEDAIKNIMKNKNIVLRDTQANLIKSKKAHADNRRILLYSLPVKEPTKEELKKLQEERQKELEKQQKEGMVSFIKHLITGLKKSFGNDLPYAAKEMYERVNRPNNEHVQYLSYFGRILNELDESITPSTSQIKSIKK